MTATATVVEVILFGGPSDGEKLSLESHKEKTKVGVNIYVDSFHIDSQGRSVFYCAKGEGKLSRKFVDKLFEGDDIF